METKCINILGYVHKKGRKNDSASAGQLQIQKPQTFLFTVSIFNKNYYLKYLSRGIRHMSLTSDTSVETVFESGSCQISKKNFQNALHFFHQIDKNGKT
jgi:hypothetical protein